MPAVISPRSGSAQSLNAPPTRFYQWGDYRCAYEFYPPADVTAPPGAPLLLVHPVGVGLARPFWHRFCATWGKDDTQRAIYNLDLLGCGESDCPRLPYRPILWAEQLLYFLQTVVRRPAILLVQGALFPAAVELTASPGANDWVQGLVLSGPPSWRVMTQASPAWRQQLNWQVFNSLFGEAFYQYARSESFLRSFSERQLFANSAAVDRGWLEMLQAGAANRATRHAVLAFLAGFWRQDYTAKIEAITLPTLVVVGDRASSISRSGEGESPDERLSAYLHHLPNGQAVKIPGRNVLPYENTQEFVSAIASFVREIGQF